MQCYATLTSLQSKFLHIKKAFSLSVGNLAVKNILRVPIRVLLSVY